MESPDYSLKLKNNSSKGRDIYEFDSADGVEPKKSFRDSKILIADEVKINDSSLLVVEANYGFLGAVLGDKNSGKTTVVESSDRAFQLCRINLEKNNVEASTRKTAFYSELGREFEKAVYSPKSYEPVDLVKSRISDIINILETGGELYIAGGKKDGINRYKKQLKKTNGDLEKIAQRGSQKLYRYTKTSEIELKKPKIETEFSAEVMDSRLEFKACKGLFSPHSLDNGSRLLIENVELKESEDILDLACGYGAVGLFLEKIFDCNVSFTDDNALATHYTQRNIEKNGSNASRIENKDCLDGFKNQKFDAIISNPPTHQGSKITDEMFKKSYQQLRPEGKLFIVYNQNMGFENQLSNLFKKVEIVAEKNNFKVAKAQK